MEQLIKVGSWTNAGRVLFIDTISELIPDPICKVSSTKLCSHRLSQLILLPEPQSEVDKKIRLKQLMKEKHELVTQLQKVEAEIDSLKEC